MRTLRPGANSAAPPCTSKLLSISAANQYGMRCGTKKTNTRSGGAAISTLNSSSAIGGGASLTPPQGPGAPPLTVSEAEGSRQLLRRLSFWSRLGRDEAKNFNVEVLRPSRESETDSA